MLLYSPYERVLSSSMQKVWKYVKEVIKDIDKTYDKNIDMNEEER
jgi:hypothetical protein